MDEDGGTDDRRAVDRPPTCGVGTGVGSTGDGCVPSEKKRRRAVERVDADPTPTLEPGPANTPLGSPPRR